MLNFLLCSYKQTQFTTALRIVFKINVNVLKAIGEPAKVVGNGGFLALKT